MDLLAIQKKQVSQEDNNRSPEETLAAGMNIVRSFKQPQTFHRMHTQLIQTGPLFKVLPNVPN